MEKKYELLKDDTIIINDRTLYRIKALKDFDDIEEGYIGGYIEKEENLSHEGDCWVYDNAKVFASAEVSDNAKIFDNAIVFGRSMIYDEAKVCDNAKIYGNAMVYNRAVIYDDAEVYDDAEIYDGAKVYGKADIYSYAEICGNAEVYDDAEVCSAIIIGGYTKIFGNNKVRSSNDYLTIYKIGSRDDAITFIKNPYNKIEVTTGCFHGDIKTFKRKVRIRHHFNKYAKEYKLAIKMAKLKFK